MRTFASLAAFAISGVVLWKLLVGIALPLFGLLAALAAMTFRLALVAGVAYLIYSMIRKRREAAEA